MAVMLRGWRTATRATSIRRRFFYPAGKADRVRRDCDTVGWGCAAHRLPDARSNPLGHHLGRQSRGLRHGVEQGSSPAGEGPILSWHRRRTTGGRTTIPVEAGPDDDPCNLPSTRDSAVALPLRLLRVNSEIEGPLSFRLRHKRIYCFRPQSRHPA